LASFSLRTLSTASETYSTSNAGHYPESIDDLLNGKPPYISKRYCDETISGYIYKCHFAKNGYLFLAKPIVAGLSEMTLAIKTGGILTTGLEAQQATMQKASNVISESLSIKKIDPPHDLKAEFYMDGDDAFVKVTWKHHDKAASLTQGYYIESDYIKPGEMTHRSIEGLIKGNEYILKINSKGGRDFQFNVIPFDHKNLWGQPGHAQCYVPLIKLPWITKFNTTLIEETKGVKLTWEYPQVPDLFGFQVFMNGEKIAGPKKIDGVTRSWIVSNPVVGKNGYTKFKIQAVGEVAISRFSLEKSLFLPKNWLRTKTNKPENLRVKLIIKKDGQYAQLNWDKVDLEQQGLQGYILYVDYASEGSVQRMSSLPFITENQYLYKLPENTRDRYTFRIAGITDSREITQYSEVVLEKNWPKYNSGLLRVQYL